MPDCFTGGFVQTWQVTKLTVMSLVKIFQRQVPLNTLGGPIFIAQAAGEQARAGAVNLIFFIGLLSVNLGLLNLLPVPVLDGGHLAFFAWESITRRPVSTRSRERAQQAGLVLIIMLMALVFYNDLARIIGPYLSD